MPQPEASPPERPLTDVARLALDEARRQGASEAEADVSVSQGLSVNVRLGEVDTVEYQRDRGLAVTVYFGKRKGSASTADLTAAAVRASVEKACAIARYTAEDPYAGLIEPEMLAREIPDLDLDHPWDLTPERAIELARDVRGGGTGGGCARQQFRGRCRQHAAPHRRIRQLARLPGRLFLHQPLPELLAPRPGRRGHAA